MKREMSSERPTIWIGKGLVEKVIDEVSKQLEKNEMVKVRILKGALKNESAESIIQKVTQETNSTLVDRRGHVFVLYRRRKRKKSL
jgi:RNA-binding protein